MIVFTMTSHSYDVVWKDCIASQRIYCERHGYEYYHFRLPSRLTPDSTAWSKLYLLRALLRKQIATHPGEMIMYIDADCEIKSTCPTLDTL